MKFEDFIISPPQKKYESWQLGSALVEDLPENGIALLVVTDYRGNHLGELSTDFGGFRDQLYALSASEFKLPFYDFGNLISGKSHQDTHCILIEVLSACHHKNTVPIIVGGSMDLSFSLFSALNLHLTNINFTQISNTVHLAEDGEDLNEKNYLARLFSLKEFSLKNFALLGYQNHLNDVRNIKLMKEVDFDIYRLADMMKNSSEIEPFFRKAHLATVNANAVESVNHHFSVHPQVNGLNRREICAYMKEIGLSENLKSVGIFNAYLNTKNVLNHQLMAQMIWYCVEGIEIQNSHPKEKKTETFYVLAEDEKYTFKRDVFSELWYFGDSESLEECLPCSLRDYENAKKGILNSRLLKFLNR